MVTMTLMMLLMMMMVMVMVMVMMMMRMTLTMMKLLVMIVLDFLAHLSHASLGSTLSWLFRGPAKFLHLSQESLGEKSISPK
eukprot:4212510-Amphidinium_carterae.1